MRSFRLGRLHHRCTLDRSRRNARRSFADRDKRPRTGSVQRDMRSFRQRRPDLRRRSGCSSCRRAVGTDRHRIQGLERMRVRTRRSSSCCSRRRRIRRYRARSLPRRHTRRDQRRRHCTTLDRARSTRRQRRSLQRDTPHRIRRNVIDCSHSRRTRRGTRLGQARTWRTRRRRDSRRCHHRKLSASATPSPGGAEVSRHIAACVGWCSNAAHWNQTPMRWSFQRSQRTGPNA